MTIRESSISDERLEQLVCAHRDKAGAADRLMSTELKAAYYRTTQNGWADLFQELLDRRRASNQQ